MKKTLSILLAFIMLLLAAPVGCLFKNADFLSVKTIAANENDLSFELNENGNSYYVSGCSAEAEGDILIPSTHNNKPVTAIESYAFYGCVGITSIEISDGILSIGECAFLCCESLISIAIPDSVVNIGGVAFSLCNNLKEINVSKYNKNFSSIDGVLFNFDKTELICCPAGKSGAYSIPYGVIKIGDYAFAYSETITSVEIPESITEIGYGAFGCCTGITFIEIPDSVISIGEDAFCDCENLEIYCSPDSYAHQYATENNISIALTIITETENSIIDYDDKLIFTKLQLITDMAQVVTVPPTLSVEQTGLYETDNIRLYSTGSLFWIFENGINTEVYTLIVEGDLNSDSVCDVCDAVLAEEALNGIYPLNEVQICAANGCYSEEVDITSYQNVVNAALA